MPDKILHKRSLTPGSVPTTSSLELGELAINVADGKVHLRRSGSGNNDVVSIVTANTTTTGSINATSFTGSLFGTSSWTENYTESDPIFTAVSSSYITTSSFNTFTASYNTGSFTGSFNGIFTGTASYATFALTASHALNVSTGVSETLAIAYAIALG